MPKPAEITHTGLTVNARKIDHEEDPLEGAGLYEFYVELDGVPVVLGVKKAGTVDQRRAKLAKQRQTQAAPAASPSTPSA